MVQQTKAVVRLSDEVVVIDIEGDMTSASHAVIEQAYEEASGTGQKKILLTFREEDYINSAGIASIIKLVTESRKKEEVVRLATPSAHFRKLFGIVGLTQHVQVFSSAEEALEDF